MTTKQQLPPELATIDCQVQDTDGGERFDVVLAVIPEGWADRLEEHPQDDSVYYWLQPEEVADIKVGVIIGDATVTEVYL